MFERGALSRDPGTDVAPGGAGAPVGISAAVPPISAEEATELLASLVAGGELAGVVEELLARLLVRVQDDDDGDSAEGPDDGVGADDGDLFADEPGGDAALVATAEGREVVGVEESAAAGLLGLGAAGLGELAAACHRLAAWATWGESLAAACLTGCGELSAHPDQWGPGGTVSPVVGYEERRFNTTCLLSARLGISRTRAGRIVDHGSALMDVGFGPTEAMERCGALDAAKACLVTRRLEGVPTPVALAVQKKVLPQAPRRSVSQVGRDIERALMQVDPEGHAERARADVERRCVSRPRSAGEGVSQIRLLLPTMDAVLLDATLDAIAASARAAGEQRTLAQLRADAITAMTLSTLRTGQRAAFSRLAQDASSDRTERRTGECGSEAAASSPAAPAASPTARDSWAASGTIDPESVGSRVGGLGDRRGAGGSRAETAADDERGATAGASPGRLLPDGIPLEGLLGALSGLVGSTSPWWTPSATGRPPLPENIRIDVQVTVPITSLASPAGLDNPADPAGLAPPADLAGRGPGGGPGGGDSGGDDSGDGERNQDLAKDSGDAARTDSAGTSPPGSSGRSPTATSGSSPPSAGGRSLPACGQDVPASQSTTAAETITAAELAAGSISTAQNPAALAQATEVAKVRIGSRSVAVPALTAWALATGGTWRRLVTDPISGVVLDVGRTRYRPPAGLADLVRARDRSCVFPTCQIPAQRCDIDHLTPWSRGGTTSLDNLVTLCQAHHRLKHTPGWELTRDESTGDLSWRTPDKTVYQRHPDGAIDRLPRKVGPHQHDVPGAVVPANVSKQITPDLIDRLNTALDEQAHDHAVPGTSTCGGGRVRLATRGPRPGGRAGDYETTPYPRATHILGLAPLIDEAPPF